MQAVEGKGKSGVTVLSMIRSISSGRTPAMAKARRAASAAKVDVYSPSAAIRRSLIPVLVVIHSSLVSTNCSISALVRIFAGKADPVPVILTFTIESPLLCRRLAVHSHRDRMIFRQFFGDMLGHTALCILMSKADRVLDRLDVGTAMTDHADAIDSEKRSTTVFCIVNNFLEAVKRSPHEQIADLGYPTLDDLPLQHPAGGVRQAL